MSTTRTLETLQHLLQDKEQLLSTRLQYAIEYHIAQKKQEEQAKAWQELPFLVQFLPVLIKYRKDFSLLKWVNPDIPHGGLTEYDKHSIYDAFPGTFRLDSVHILEEEYPGKEHILTTMQEAKMSFPCMLKADVGERGVGIYYLVNETALEKIDKQFLDADIQRQKSSLQSYCDRPQEWCLQFYRDDQTIKLGSLVRRHIVAVVGDGSSSVQMLIEQLILAEQHRDTIIKTLQQDEASLLTTVPAPGQTIQVVRKASIDYGTRYEDITNTLTESQKSDIQKLLETMLQHLPELYVGRFDLKAKSLETLIKGECKIIECNAGGGIPTHVYDEHLSIDEKYNILYSHFDTMKVIAEKNKNAGKSSGSFFSDHLSLFSAVIRSINKKGITITSFSNNKSKKVFALYKELFSYV